MRRMQSKTWTKKTSLLLAAAAFLALSGAASARAQLLKAQKPAPTPARYISMLYDKLTGKMPDFALWALDTPEYIAAKATDRPKVEEKTVKNLTDIFNLMTVSEPIVLEVDAQISSYSAMGGGFLVQNFNDLTFFDYGYRDKRYALVPHGIVDYQWLHDIPEESQHIMQETQNGRHAHMVFTMVPLAADPTPMPLNGHTYRLIMADIQKIEMWSADGKSIVWDSTMNDPGSLKSRLMNMYNK
jgi:hypothetical protein